jgi:hypothetical protein
MDSTYLHPECNPDLIPALRRGPLPDCSCNHPGCMDCRNRAKGRRWYRANAERVNAALRMKRMLNRAQRQWERAGNPLTDSDLDRKALEMLRQEGLR